MRIDNIKKWLLALASVGGVFLLASAPAFALCATCYTAALGAKGIQALKSGTLILLIPTLTIFSGLIWITFRNGNSHPSWPSQAREEQTGSPSHSDVLGRLAAEAPTLASFTNLVTRRW